MISIRVLPSFSAKEDIPVGAERILSLPEPGKAFELLISKLTRVSVVKAVEELLGFVRHGHFCTE
jgi:hypothetical protein